MEIIILLSQTKKESIMSYDVPRKTIISIGKVRAASVKGV